MSTDQTAANILVIDDTIANLQILVSMLDRQGYHVRPVNNGRMGLRAAQLSTPDLILLDIQMPKMDGFEVCRALKEDPETNHIPIIFISALAETRDKVKAFQTGGVDYITKPFQMEEVLARVNTHLEIERFRKQDQRLIREQEALISELNAYAHTVAHDLKNPLSIISGFAELLVGDSGDIPLAQQREILEKIRATSVKMDEIINSLLLLSSMRNQQALEVEPIMMRYLLFNAQSRLELLIAKHEVDLVMPATWPLALGYADWVEEVWVNYISNAIKYGGRPCRVELGADTQPDGFVRFWVQDNGNGLTPEEQETLFTPFTRAKGAVGIEGHGLGLSIVERIVKKLNGEVGLTSQIGKGCRFYFTLPIADINGR